MADPTHLAELLKGVESWNAWRAAHPEIENPDLSEVDFTADEFKSMPLYTRDNEGNLVLNFSRADLRGAILYSANLQSARLWEANLQAVNFRKANLQDASLIMANLQGAYPIEANLQDADLIGADLQGAYLRSTNLQSAKLEQANLQGARLERANFQGANLSNGNLQGANLRGANLEGANVTGVRFSRGSGQRAFQGIRVSTCYGNQIFKSFAQDQDYIETFRASGGWRAGMFRLWYITSDCGRSLLWWAGWSVLIAVSFCLFYFFMGPELIRVDSPLPFSWRTMLYFSVVTFTTLGFGDIKPATESAAMVVMLEVILGYIMLGGLIAIFANKVARRS